MVGPIATLELALDPDSAARLPRLPEFRRLRAGRLRRSTSGMVWYDTPEATLAADGLSLCERRVGRETTWRLERIRATLQAPWPPGTPAPLVAEAPLPAGLPDLPAPLLPVAAFSGELRSLPLAAEAAPGAVTLLHGTLRAVAGERGVCRVLLTGPPERLQELALTLAAALPLRVPEAALAALAYMTAGRAVPPRAIGAPALPAHITIAEAFARVAAHLTAVLLHWAPLAAAGESAEPVHQMRVALRRLRSAIALFEGAVGGPDIDNVNIELRALADMLGPARDWDVFCAGTGRAVGDSFPEDRAVKRLLAAAERQRQAGYAALRAYLGSPAFRRLGLHLACLAAFRPWEAASDGEAAGRQAAPLAGFAAKALTRRLERVLAPGDTIATLPLDALHKLRIQSKRLRYAAELFAPLFAAKPARRCIRRVSDLQERLGHLNDGAVAEALMAQLPGGGGERAMAAGIVRGFVAAGMHRARTKSVRSWRRLRRLEPFWN